MLPKQPQNQYIGGRLLGKGLIIILKFAIKIVVVNICNLHKASISQYIFKPPHLVEASVSLAPWQRHCDAGLLSCSRRAARLVINHLDWIIKFAYSPYPSRNQASSIRPSVQPSIQRHSLKLFSFGNHRETSEYSAAATVNRM